jgi:hypothetical protein
MGQLYALVTPNEETANGLAGLSVILSVCLMGFLITSSAMPEGWLWAYHMNLFRYILQGLVTNELSGQNYNIDVGHLIPEISNSTGSSYVAFVGDNAWDALPDSNNNLKAISFIRGEVPDGDNYSAQAARLVGLALDEYGENADTPKAHADLKSLLSCLVENDCVVEPVPTNFIQCTADICAYEFNEVISNHEDGKTKVARCFGGDLYYDVVSTVLATDNRNHHEVASCMMRKLLPATGRGRDGIGGAHHIIKGFKELQEIVMFIQDIIEKGIDVPGDAILFYFGWAQFDADEFTFSAPWKWHYCITAVAIFLIGMELIKLFAVNFIVWTKR